jgi:hypothetical protein
MRRRDFVEQTVLAAAALCVPPSTTFAFDENSSERRGARYFIGRGEAEFDGISFEEAKRIALAKIGPDCALIETETVEKPYGWYFMGQSRAYLETGNVLMAVFGSAGFIVERSGGRVFEFGSAYPAEQWIANYERGFKYDRYDLCVVAVTSLPRTIELLDFLDMHYVVPEEEYGTVWRIPCRYTSTQLGAALGRLPCTFTDQPFWHRVDVFDEIDASGCCKYELREHVAEM